MSHAKQIPIADYPHLQDFMDHLNQSFFDGESCEIKYLDEDNDWITVRREDEYQLAKQSVTMLTVQTATPGSSQAKHKEDPDASSNSMAEEWCDFVGKAVTSYHAVEQISGLLKSKGFTKLVEKQEWNLQPSGKYFYTRNQNCIIAFIVGKDWTPGDGFRIVGTHTDSPHLKLKPISKITKNGALEVGVEAYGGGLWHTWFDRDLTLAGQVLVKREGKVRGELLHVERPILRIPNLAIHLYPELKTEGFNPNPETHLLPILATQLAGDDDTNADPNQRMHGELLSFISSELNCSVDSIIDYELGVVDTQAAVIGGLRKEFIFSPRLDNLMSTFCAMQTLANMEVPDKGLHVVSSYNHEEVGSESNTGAQNTMFRDFMRRVNLPSDSNHPQWSRLKEELFDESVGKSFLVSMDMAHAWHPNYPERHEDNHRPTMGGGVIIKTNQNQRYATTASTGYILREVARRDGVPVQEFCVRNDSPCGTTIGPIISSVTGLRTVDCGMPQLAMHSIREMCGVKDVANCMNLIKAFYHHYDDVDGNLEIDDQ